MQEHPILQQPQILHTRQFVIEAHGEQRYGRHPYIFHLDAVAQLLIPYGEDAVILGYLHDVLEDTETPEALLLEHYGPFLTRCVRLLTDAEGHNRKERKRKAHQTFAQIRAQDEEKLVLIVKTADRLANTRQCHKEQNTGLLRMYKREYPAFRDAVWRPNLAQELWQELDPLST